MIENEQHSIAEICLDHGGKDGMFLFDSAEPGQHNQCNFIHLRHLQAEVDKFLNAVFDHLLKSYSKDYCKAIHGGTGHVQREAKV